MRAESRSKLIDWRHNPKLFAWDNFKVDLEEWQADALSLCSSGKLTPKRLVGMKACTGPGKTAILAIAGWQRLVCFGERGEHPKGAALSGEGRDNLRDNLWAEMSKWQTRSPFLMGAFKWGKELIVSRHHPQTWFLAARSYAKDADSEAIGTAISGLHSKYPFILLDEIGNMPPQVGQKAQQIFTGGCADGLIAAAGNPTSVTGLLYVICTTEAGMWQIITITADPDDPRRTKRVDPEHAREMIKLYGRENPWVMATILGKFPPGGFNTLIAIDDVHAAMNRKLAEADYMYSQKRLGIDVARFGDDASCIFPRQGLASFNPVVMRGWRTNEIGDRVMVAKVKWQSETEMIDGTGGYGAGVADYLRLQGVSPLEINFSSQPTDPRYLNKRAEMWFEMANWIKRGGRLPKDGQLARELSSPMYSFQRGKFQLEPKELLKKRLGFSPDQADALALTFAIPEAKRNEFFDIARALEKNRGGMIYDKDPFADDRR